LNLPVSTEITGYALSTFVYLYALSGEARYLTAARRAAHYLTRHAWDPASGVMPFEIAPVEYAYFFDCGIIVRGLLAMWRTTCEQELLDVANAIGDFMMRSFSDGSGGYHPILELPSCKPVERDPLRWSRSTGCYQLKSAMAWSDLYEATGEQHFLDAYEGALEASLATFRDFLPGHPEPHKVTDRLHAFGYFLEGLLPRATEPRCADALGEGIEILGHHLRRLEPDFARSDAFAQLLRARIHADAVSAVPLDRSSAEWEAVQLAAFQRPDGGYWFGRKYGEWLPFVNPVSTSFACQALELWAGTMNPLYLLI
jgi:hypothetical protein